jgi:mannonate dehydratase
VLEEERWHARLLNGSDYPLPGVMPITSVDYLVSHKLIAPAAAPVLREIRLYNALAFDFVLKRSLNSNGKRFAPRVFQTRRYFEARV